MNTCALCRNSDVDLLAVSGLSFCGACRVGDPTDALADHGIEVEWDTQLMRLSAGFGIPDQDPELELRCVPAVWHHRLRELVTTDVETGDAVFDDALWITASDDARAAKLLRHEGVQSAVLALLSGVRQNELASNHVTLKGPSLLISTRPLASTAEKLQELKIEATALALHLRDRGH